MNLKDIITRMRELESGAAATAGTSTEVQSNTDDTINTTTATTQSPVYDSLLKQIENTSKKVERTENIVYVGFLVLLLMMGGLLFSYLEFIFYSWGNDADYKSNLVVEIAKLQTITPILQDQIKELKSENQELKEKINCAKNKKYWQYEQCFR